MQDSIISRRVFLAATPALSLTPALFGAEPDGDRAWVSAFPAQPPDLVRDIVTVSHFSFDRVRALVSQRPQLAKAAWDWGFGDWETALGAASHTGNRDIARLLLDHGARMDVFAAAMLGLTPVVRAFIESRPGIQRTRGPHGITLLAHAAAGGPEARDTVEYLRSIEGADDAPTDIPLSAEGRARYEGEYGAAPGLRITVRSWTDRAGADHLVIERPGSPFRALNHVGEHAFSPWGAPDVRVVFTMGPDASRATALAITAPAPVLTATRVG